MITDARLADLQRMAERATLAAGSGIGVTGPELLELISAYRENVIDFGELKGPASGDAFLGGMLGAFAGGMLERKLREFEPGSAPLPAPPVKGIPKAKQHRWKELHGLGGGWTCARCKKSASQVYGKERLYCSAAPAQKGSSRS